MSLYGALYSGVSGLSAQSSAMAAISDNISNVNTTGYKGTDVKFQTLVTKQVSLTNYSAGGVQSVVSQGVDVQGLLESSNSSTDLGISGSGFFVVSSNVSGGEGSGFAYTRAGSFKVDENGYLKNTSGWYMQGWPLMAYDNTMTASTVQSGNETFMKAYKNGAGETVYINDNIVSQTHLRAINLNEIGGTASQTRNLRFGANLSNDTQVGKNWSQSITMYDSLGGAADIDLNFKKVAQNNWAMEAMPPKGSKSMTLRNQTPAGDPGAIYSAVGRLDFESLPQTGGQIEMKINGTDYTFIVGPGTDGTPADTFYTSTAGVNASTFAELFAKDINTAYQLEYNSQQVTLGNLDLTIDGTTTNFTATTAAALNADPNFVAAGMKAFQNGTQVSIYTERAMTYTVDDNVMATPVTWTSEGTIYAEQISGTSSMIFRQVDSGDAVELSGLNSMLQANGNPATLQGMDLIDSDTIILGAAVDRTLSAVEFNGDGSPKAINVGFAQIDWANGSVDMDGLDSIKLFMGNTGVQDGLTQLSGASQLGYWNQDGALFGNFAGVSVGSDGIVTALFDNGVTVPIFQIPVATFVNPNGMESRTGNVWIETDYSGEPTLRAAGTAGSGQINSATLEASTVDIGTEFTSMIITQRAYSAASKIITTADQMLDELVNIKR